MVQCNTYCTCPILWAELTIVSRLARLCCSLTLVLAINHSYTHLLQFTTERQFNLWWVKYRGKGDIKAFLNHLQLALLHMLRSVTYVRMTTVLLYRCASIFRVVIVVVSLSEPHIVMFSRCPFAVKKFASGPMVRGSFVCCAITWRSRVRASQKLLSLSFYFLWFGRASCAATYLVLHWIRNLANILTANSKYPYWKPIQ